MIRKIIYVSLFALFLQANSVNAGMTGSEELKGSDSESSAPGECFEGLSRAIFKFNHTLDGAIFEPVAKGYRTLPVGLRKGTSNIVNNLRSLLTLIQFLVSLPDLLLMLLPLLLLLPLLVVL